MAAIQVRKEGSKNLLCTGTNEHFKISKSLWLCERKCDTCLLLQEDCTP